MKLSEYIAHLDFVIKAHPRLANQPFGLAVKAGQDALKVLDQARSGDYAVIHMLLPGEDPDGS